MPDYLKILIPSVLGFLTTIGAAFISARWAVRRALQERWWDRKEKQYAELLAALHDMLRYAALCLEEYKARSDGHAKKDEFRERYSQAYWNIQRITDIGAFVISEEAASVLRRLREKPRLDWDEGPPEELREAECKDYREALNEIRHCARKDLRV